jgi:hypothetical protein
LSPVDSLRAFTRLYGLVRWFHPSDEASAIDWDAFAVHGAARVRAAPTLAALQATLTELFAPIAPTVAFYHEGGSLPDPARLFPGPGTPYDTVAWQHLGFGDTQLASVYRSKRTGRTAQFALSDGEGGFSQAVNAAALRGRTVRLSAAVRCEPRSSLDGASLLLRVRRTDGELRRLPGTRARPIRSDTWAEQAVSGVVPNDAEALVIGGELEREGNAWFDDIVLEVAGDDGSWTQIPLPNGDFEAGIAPWEEASIWYEYQIDPAQPYDGATSLRMTEKRQSLDAAPLFASSVKLGDVVECPLVGGLWAQVPLALASVEGRTLGEPRGSLTTLEAALAADVARHNQDIDPLADLDTRLGAVVVAWNVLQHFYPYFDEVDVDWDAALTSALAAMPTAQGAEDVEEVLQRMLAQTRDGHGFIIVPGLPDRRYLPLTVADVEGQLVVVASATEQVARGDVLLRIDGTPARERFAAVVETIVGSPQACRYHALARLVTGPAGERAALLLSRDGAELRARPRGR